MKILLRLTLVLRPTPIIIYRPGSWIRNSAFPCPGRHGGSEKALALPEIELVGIHCHIGSQVFNSASFRFAAERMIDFMAAVKEETGHQLTVLNLGGGLGISYTENDQPDL